MAAAETTSDWAPVFADRLTAELIEGLLAQEIAYVRIPGFLSTARCEELTRRFLAFMEQHPEHRLHLRPTSEIDITMDAVVLPMNYFAQFQPPRLDEYLSRVPKDRPALRALYEGGKDPFEAVQTFWREAGWNVVTAQENGRPYLTDVLWGTFGRNVSPPHIDTYHLELECMLNRFPRRVSCNAFIQPPESGGRFRVFKTRRRKASADLEMPPDIPVADYDVNAGDLIVFDAGNFHQILPSGGTRHRLFSHSAVLIDPEARACTFIA